MTVIVYYTLINYFITVSVYPGGSMLEMSNGYPNSSSPGLGGSPSPGPSPIPPNIKLKIDEASKTVSYTHLTLPTIYSV